MRCWSCAEVVYEAVACAACAQLFHAACLSEEGEDGQLCRDCRTECPDCAMPIVLDEHRSDHLVPCAYGGPGLLCPEYSPGRLEQQTRLPQVFACFPRTEVEHLRADIRRCTQGRAGIFTVTGLEHVAARINKRLAPILGRLPATETYAFHQERAGNPGNPGNPGALLVAGNLGPGPISVPCRLSPGEVVVFSGPVPPSLLGIRWGFVLVGLDPTSALARPGSPVV